jgi:hypothetical protein
MKQIVVAEKPVKNQSLYGLCVDTVKPYISVLVSCFL